MGDRIQKLPESPAECRLLHRSAMLKELQDTNQMTKKMVLMEQCKTLPLGDGAERNTAEDAALQQRDGLTRSKHMRQRFWRREA